MFWENAGLNTSRTVVASFALAARMNCLRLLLSNPDEATSAEGCSRTPYQGIEVCMLTGDGERTASAVAGRLGNIQYIADAVCG